MSTAIIVSLVGCGLCSIVLFLLAFALVVHFVRTKGGE